MTKRNTIAFKTDECRKIINRIGLCNSIKDNYPEEYEYLRELVTWDKYGRNDQISDLYITNSIYKKLMLCYIGKDGKRNDDNSISWIDCVKRKHNGDTEIKSPKPVIHWKI